MEMMRTDSFTYSLANEICGDVDVRPSQGAPETNAIEMDTSTASIVNVDGEYSDNLESSFSTQEKKNMKRKLYTKPNYFDE
jgi:hypothetical protein